jgi:hypothetical protein
MCSDQRFIANGIEPKHKGARVMLLMVYIITDYLSIMCMSMPLQKREKDQKHFCRVKTKG